MPPSSNTLTADAFRQLPDVLRALQHPRSPRSVLNYIYGCDTADPDVRRRLSTDSTVGPLLHIWFASGTALDDSCARFAPVVRELTAEPPSLVGGEWDSLEGKVAKVFLGDQLSRSCFRGTAEAFAYDAIGRRWVRELVSPDQVGDTLKLPAGMLYLLPWALAHSEDLTDVEVARELIDLSIQAYPSFKLFKERNKPAVDQHLQVLKRFGRYPHRNSVLGRESTNAERAWLSDRDRLPIWAGGNLAADQILR